MALKSKKKKKKKKKEGTISSLEVQWLKDLVSSLQQLRWLLWHGFNPWPWNFLMHGCGQKIKNKAV